MSDHPSPAVQFLSLLEAVKAHDCQIQLAPTVVGAMSPNGVWQQFPPEQIHKALVEKHRIESDKSAAKSALMRGQVKQLATTLILDANRVAVPWEAVLRLIGTWDYRKHYLNAWTQATTLAAMLISPNETIAPSPSQPSEGDWSKPMSKAEMTTRLHLNRRSFNTFAAQHSLKKMGRQLWQIRLNQMDQITRRKIETGK